MLRLLYPKSPEKESDEDLLARYLRSGESRYLGILYERYMPMVYGVCLKVLRDPGKAEDAVMGIYEELERKLKDHQVDAFRGWLYVLARNYCLMEWRKTQRRPTDLYAPEDMSRYDAVQESEVFELPGQGAVPLEKCMGELPEQQRRSVQMFYYEDKSYREIADTLQDDVNKIRSYIQNGRRNLKICLEKSGVRSMPE